MTPPPPSAGKRRGITAKEGPPQLPHMSVCQFTATGFWFCLFFSFAHRPPLCEPTSPCAPTPAAAAPAAAPAPPLSSLAPQSCPDWPALLLLTTPAVRQKKRDVKWKISQSVEQRHILRDMLMISTPTARPRNLRQLVSSSGWTSGLIRSLSKGRRAHVRRGQHPPNTFFSHKACS